MERDSRNSEILVYGRILAGVLLLTVMTLIAIP